MRFCTRYGALILVLLAIAPATAWAAKSNEIEVVAGWYFPSDLEVETLNTKLNYQDTFSYGARYGHRFSDMFGIGVSWTHVDMDAARSDADRLGCSTCDFDVDFADFSFEWYPGGHNWALYGGLGWATGEFEISIPGDSNDRNISDDAFTYHVGAAWTWNFNDTFYIRPDIRVRWFDLDKSGRGKYDSEDSELRVGLGWRF